MRAGFIAQFKEDHCECLSLDEFVEKLLRKRAAVTVRAFNPYIDGGKSHRYPNIPPSKTKKTPINDIININEPRFDVFTDQSNCRSTRMFRVLFASKRKTAELPLATVNIRNGDLCSASTSRTQRSNACLDFESRSDGTNFLSTARGFMISFVTDWNCRA